MNASRAVVHEIALVRRRVRDVNLSVRFVNSTRPVRSDRARPRDPLGWRYFPAGTGRRSSSAKFRSMTISCSCWGAWAEPSGITTATRLPSGARSQLVLQQDITIAMVFSVAVSASCRLEWQRKTSYVFMPFGD